MYRVEKSYVDKLVALKYLALSLSKSSLELLIDQNRFLPYPGRDHTEFRG